MGPCTFVAADEFVEALFVRSKVNLKVSGSIRIWTSRVLAPWCRRLYRAEGTQGKSVLNSLVFWRWDFLT